MALSQSQIKQIKEHLDNCKNPLFFFDDDQDGLCSFLLLYRYKKEGMGIIVKTTPKLGTVFLKKIQEYEPDKIFVLDIADVEQEFLDKVKVPVVWIDHHGPFERDNVKYFNPRISNWDDNQPTSYMCYQVVNEDLWLATIGCIADWFKPSFIEDFMKEYPNLIDNNYKTPGDIIYNTKLGRLIRIFSFILKGKTNDVMRCVKVLTRINSPYEILNQETAQGKFIYRYYEKINKMYLPLLKEVSDTSKKTSDKLIFFFFFFISQALQVTYQMSRFTGIRIRQY